MEKFNNFYPNQRQVKVNRNKVEKSSGFTYACIYRYSIENAMFNLKPNTFKVWLWFASNKPNYNVEYSPAYISKALNISTNTAKSAFNELKEKGYILMNSNRNNYYDFYEEPQKKDETREIINEYTGEIMTLTREQTIAMFGLKGVKLWGGK